MKEHIFENLNLNFENPFTQFLITTKNVFNTCSIVNTYTNIPQYYRMQIRELLFDRKLYYILNINELFDTWIDYLLKNVLTVICLIVRI